MSEQATTPTRPPLEEMRARAEAATKPPWTGSGRGSLFGGGDAYVGLVACPRKPDGAFIAAARTDLPAALDWIAHVEGLLARAREALPHTHQTDGGIRSHEPDKCLACRIRAALGGGR
jgi:hypothetical protein